MSYLHTKFHMPSSNGSLVITIKLKTNYTFHAATIPLSYIVQKQLIFRRSITVHNVRILH